MPRGSSTRSSEHIHSDYRETTHHKTTSSTSTINTVGSTSLNPTQSTDYRLYANIEKFDSSKRLILSKFFNSTRSNNSTYENLCSGCGYGVFEARGKLCNFCQYVINGYLEEDNSNIYENICDKCSELYSGGECLVCCSSKNTNKVNKGDNTSTTTTTTTTKTTSKKLKKRLFHSLLGSLKRVKSFNVTTIAPIATPPNDRKLQIVHNVDGYDNVFRTNETFDLNRICELKRLKSSSSDQHIYGKLRGVCDDDDDDDDDHLLQTPYECVKQKSQSDDYLIGGGTGTSRKSHHNSTAIYLRKLQNSVSEWMTSLRGETHDYYSFGAPDTVICNPKSIPANLELPYRFSSADDQQLADVRLRSLSEQIDFADQMVNEFKRSLMEKQQQQQKSGTKAARVKRQGIYLKLDDIEATSNYLVGDHRNNCLSPSSSAAQPQSALPPIQQLTFGSENSRRGVAHQLSKRCCIYEKDSEFVSDILQAFDSFLLRESTTDTETSTTAAIDEVNSAIQTINKKNTPAIVDRTTSDLSFPFSQQIDIEAIIHQLNLSKSLNKILITYDLPLKVFLSGIDQSPNFGNFDLLKIFRRFQVFFHRRNVPTSAVLLSSDRARSLTKNYIPAIEDIPNLRNFETNLVDSSTMTVPNGTLVSVTKDQEEEPIYQPIWKFKTVGEVQEETDITDEYYQPRTCDSSSASIAGGVDIEDHDEWEPDDEFTFTTKLMDEGGGGGGATKEPDTISTNTIQSSSGSTITGYASSISTMTIASSSSVITQHHLFRNICIFYSLEEPKIRAVLYEYDRNRCSSYFAQQQSSGIVGRGGANSSPTSASNDPLNNNSSDGSCYKLSKKSSESGGGSGWMFADSVQAWKYMLLDVNYLEDEEDMIVSENKILKSQTIKEMQSYPTSGRTLQRFKSISTGNLLNVPAEEDKKSIIERLRNKCVQIVSESQILKAQAIKEMDSSPPPVGILQRFKSISSGNLLDVPAEEDKKSITERVRNKLQRGVFKLQTRSPKENKKGRNIFRRNEATSLSLYLEDGMKPKYPIFNAPLEHLEMNETSDPDVPRFVVDCIEYIEQKDCIQMDGLYRASGNKVAIDELKQKLTDSYIYDPKLLVTDDIHTLTSLLKLFFRELGSPLIPQDSYQRLATTRNLMEASAIENMKIVFNQMKNPNRATLKYLIKHLTTVAHYSNENRMPASNLAIVWGPCILSANQIEYDIARMNTLAKVLIENYDKIFGENERLVS